MPFSRTEKLFTIPEEGFVLINVGGELKQIPIGMIAGPAYISKIKKDDYLYEIWYDKLDYEYAERNEEKFAPTSAACSAIKIGNFVGCHLDWTYDEGAEFVVHTPAIANRYASVGMASCMKELTKEVVESGEYTDMFKILPFRLVDGMNSEGVVVKTNVVPLDHDPTTRTIPTGETEVTLSANMLCRFVLDHFASASDAVDYLKAHVSLYFPKTLQAMGYESHFLIADSAKCYVVEVIENAIVSVESPIVANFYLSGVTFEDDGSVTTPELGDPITANGITPHGAGLERYNLLNEILSGADDITDVGDLRDELVSLKYTNAYKSTTNPFWHSEFVGEHLGKDVTLASDLTDFEAVEEIAIERFEHRSRDPESPYFGTWQTTHSAIYDIQNLKLNLVVQEDGVEREFAIG